jgi:hypothetical protein
VRQRLPCPVPGYTHDVRALPSVRLTPVFRAGMSCRRLKQPARHPISRASDDRFKQDYLWIVGARAMGRQITSASSGRSSDRPVQCVATLRWIAAAGCLVSM